jgi:exonuclease III
MQINLQHSRIATDNLMKLVEKEKTDIIFIQEQYVSKRKMTGITRTYRSYFLPEDSNRATM